MYKMNTVNQVGSLGNLSIEGLQQLLLSRNVHRVKESHVLIFLKIFKQELAKVGAVPVPGFYTKCVQSSNTGLLRYGILVLRDLISPKEFGVNHLSCLLTAIFEYPIIREIDGTDFTKFCTDKVAMMVLNCIRRQVKRFTPSILPEERRAIMRKAKTRSKNRSEQRLEIAAKKQGVTKSQIVRAPTRIKVKQGSGSESCDYTKSADAMALRHKCWTPSEHLQPQFLLFLRHSKS